MITRIAVGWVRPAVAGFGPVSVMVPSEVTRWCPVRRAPGGFRRLLGVVAGANSQYSTVLPDEAGPVGAGTVRASLAPLDLPTLDPWTTTAARSASS